ncbi:DUF1127 domain-containing protein [Paracoccus sediminis]|uniref:DUF1127 domain-containing protein n=1 Tax=Paracoccus sediminis TaxID=1214787 RepID=A0A238XD97_9RHOB|nr:DUF1127 domain-containing protein [Paracoccus sediminis]TBN49660.1 DUF1127 domain-containing protein [Paracoccus sediminis]SNR56927.1 protein of unknown function [Paracoccus sediminis]
MAHHAASLHALAGDGFLPRPSLGKRILTALSVRRSRLDLSQLGDDQLRDIGLTRDQVTQEIARPIWDVPRNWRR